MAISLGYDQINKINFKGTCCRRKNITRNTSTTEMNIREKTYKVPSLCHLTAALDNVPSST